MRVERIRLNEMASSPAGFKGRLICHADVRRFLAFLVLCFHANTTLDFM